MVWLALADWWNNGWIIMDELIRKKKEMNWIDLVNILLWINRIYVIKMIGDKDGEGMEVGCWYVDVVDGIMNVMMNVIMMNEWENEKERRNEMKYEYILWMNRIEM